MKKSVTIGLILLMLAAFIYAEDDLEINEDDIFPDTEVIVESDDYIDDEIGDEAEKPGISFSGQVDSSFAYNMLADFFTGDAEIDENTYAARINANLLLDVRLDSGIKAFANLAVGYIPQGMDVTHYYLDITGYPFVLPTELTVTENTTTLILFNEFFIDVNIARKAYFRVGKQVLKWGTGYLWNPADFINISKKSFADVEGYREGVYGLKMHIPFGTIANVYGFANVTDADDVSEIAYAARLEGLFWNTEAGISVWAQDQEIPVFGLDFTSRVFDIDIRGEASISYGDNKPKLIDGVDTDITDEWTPRVCLGFSKSFEVLDVQDRIMVTGEFFYNHNGYEENMFDESNPYSAPFLAGGYYEMNYYGKYYGALFTSVNKFIISDLVLNITGMGNFSDMSFVIGTGLSWNPVNNFNAGFNLYTYAGEENREYTASGYALTADMFLTLKF